MSATNETPFLKLPQFEPTDKPTWLGDFNHAMVLVDTGVASVDNVTKTQTAQINQALTQAQAAGTAAEAAAAAAREATTVAQDAALTAGAASTKAQSAIDLGNETASKLNLINHSRVADKTELSNTFGFAYGTLYFDSNADGSVFKMYGDLSGPVSSSSVGSHLVTIPGTSYKGIKTPFKAKKPENTIWLNRSGLACSGSTITPNNIYGASLAVSNADGSIYLYLPSGYSTSSTTQWVWFPCTLYFAENFGNLPGNENPTAYETQALEERVAALESALQAYAVTIPAKA